MWVLLIRSDAAASSCRTRCLFGAEDAGSPRPLRPPSGSRRLINRPLQPMKTGGNNPDKRQIWSLSYKTNFNRTPFFKSSSGWRTRELNPRGCRICFSLIALSGYLIPWQMTRTPPSTDSPPPPPHPSLSLFHTMNSVFPTHRRSSASSLTQSSHRATVDWFKS